MSSPPKDFNFSQAYLKELFDYCPSGRLIRKITKSSNAKAGTVAGGPFQKGYRGAIVCGKRWLEHRLIYYWHNGYCPAAVDHINGVRDDNRIENLRGADATINGQNRHSIQTNNTSGHTGVSWDKKRKRWYAHIKVNGKMKNLGLFADLTDAIQARLLAVALYHPHHSSNSQHG